jgi:PilZ domain-containing protein
MMGVENFGAVTQTGKRKTKRARVLLAAKLSTPNGVIEARLRDLSRKGALVECKDVPAVGSEVVFTRGATTVPARVAWTGGPRVGLEFLHMIDESEVLVQLAHKPSGQAPQRFRRPGLHGEKLSDHERKLAKVWGLAVGITVND